MSQQSELWRVVATRPPIQVNTGLSQKAAKNLHKRKQRKFEQKETKLAKVGHLSSGRLSFRIRLPPSLDSPRDFKTPICTKDRDFCNPPRRVGQQRSATFENITFAYFFSIEILFVPLCPG